MRISNRARALHAGDVVNSETIRIHPFTRRSEDLRVHIERSATIPRNRVTIRVMNDPPILRQSSSHDHSLYLVADTLRVDLLTSYVKPSRQDTQHRYQTVTMAQHSRAPSHVNDGLVLTQCDGEALEHWQGCGGIPTGGTVWLSGCFGVGRSLDVLLPYSAAPAKPGLLSVLASRPVLGMPRHP